jgi:hypothetical protein
VKLPATTIAEASELAEKLADEGCTQAEQLARVSTLVADHDIGAAIVACVEARRREQPRKFNYEPVLGIYVSALCTILVFILFLAAKWLLLWVQGSPNDDIPAIAAACGQLVLLRLSWRLLKFAGLALTDSLNKATYPTILNRPIVTTTEEDALRYERIRLIIAEMVDRMERGERFKKLYRELTEIELTRSAALWLLIQARIGLLIKANLPPYTNRTRAYILAAGAAFGCAAGIGMAKQHLLTVAHRDYLITLALLLVLEFLRTPRPQESQEAA